jgi:hypothetical protein
MQTVTKIVKFMGTQGQASTENCVPGACLAIFLLYLDHIARLAGRG